MLANHIGFSSLQQNILSDASMRNASHISTLCSLVDLYRPEYAVLENVVNMASTRVEGQNVLSQLVACLVSMGYQVNQYIMDAWSYGSAQHRSRVFLTIAAPGLEPIIQPWHTHSRPSEDTVGKSLGRLPNGERFGERELYVTPFTHLTAAGITSDLPNVGNGNVQSCVPHPDHRTPYQPGRKDRALLQCIPRQPPGSGYKEAFHLGLIPPSLQKPGKESGKGFRRIKAAGLVPTITTSQSIQDSRNGAIVHWSQDRPITILEARRTQGWPDVEPIIGSLVEQYKIVGNGVDRKVSFALGLALRQVVEQNPGRRKVDTFPVRQVEETMVDAEHAEDVDDGASVTSNIHVDVPSRKATTVRRSTAAALSERPRSGMDSPESSEDTGAGHIEAMGFDGAADVRDDTSEPPGRATPLPTPVSAPSMLSRVLVTVSNGLGGLAFRAKTSQDTTATPEIYEKRGREVSEPTKRIRSPSEGDDITAKKRARTSDSIRVPLNENTKKVRSTRHSGLALEFQPKNWNKRPEDEHSATG
jgi:DNA (cytosine-5)-methyltransferase 1